MGRVVKRQEERGDTKEPGMFFVDNSQELITATVRGLISTNKQQLSPCTIVLVELRGDGYWTKVFSFITAYYSSVLEP